MTRIPMPVSEHLTRRICNTTSRHQIFVAAALGGFALRLLVSLRGNNFDLESYKIVGQAVLDQQTPWSVGRYNYGPVWAAVSAGFAWIAGENALVFRLLLISTLSLADLTIAFVLLRLWGLRASILLLLSPVAIVISGYHNQFDNVAICIGLVGVLVLDRARNNQKWSTLLLSALLLGLSLSTKHIFLLLIPALALTIGLSVRGLTILLLPYSLFVGGFIPFLASSWSFIKTYVIDYRGYENSPLTAPIELLFGFSISPSIALLVFLAGVGSSLFFCRKMALSEQFMVYLLAVVCFSPGIANQYLAIAGIGVCAVRSGWSFAYLAVSGLHLVAHEDGLGFKAIWNAIPWFNTEVHGIQYFPSCFMLLLVLNDLRLQPTRLRMLPRTGGRSLLVS